MVDGVVAPDRDRCDAGKEWWRSPGPPIRGGTMVAAEASTTVTHMDPITGGSPGSLVYQWLLVKRGCYTGDLMLEPYLAKSWDVSSDGLVWTIKLRDNVKWHDLPPVNGRAFNSADVKFSSEQHLGGGRARSLWEGVTAVETPDPQTVVIRLRETDADFGQKLAASDNVMLPREVKEQHGDFKTVAVGTGPFMVKDFKANIEQNWIRNPNYWEMGIDDKPLPYLDGIFSPTIADYATEVATMRAGQLDMGQSLGYRKLDWDTLRRDNNKLVPWSALITTPFAVFFNHAREPWGDLRVRRAVAKALSIEDLIASNQGGVVPSGFIPAVFTEYTLPESKVRERLQQDVEGAKKLLAEAGFRQGQIKDVLMTSGAYAQDAEVTQEFLKKIGIETTLDSQGQSFTSRVQLEPYGIAAGVIGGSPFLSHFGQRVVVTKGSNNFWNFSDARVDALANAQNRELDPVKRKVLLSQLEDRLWETLPFVPTVIRYYFYFYSCRAKNTMFISNNVTHNYQFKTHMWLDSTGC